MKQITEDYCSFEVAKLLSEKGFDELSTVFYNPDGNDEIILYDYEPLRNSEIDGYAKVTHQLALKWLREVYEFIVTIDYDRYPVYNGESSIVGYGYNIQTKDNPEDYYRISESVYESYEDAVEASLKYTLENLI